MPSCHTGNCCRSRNPGRVKRYENFFLCSIVLFKLMDNINVFTRVSLSASNSAQLSERIDSSTLFPIYGVFMSSFENFHTIVDKMRLVLYLAFRQVPKTTLLSRVTQISLKTALYVCNGLRSVMVTLASCSQIQDSSFEKIRFVSAPWFSITLASAAPSTNDALNLEEHAPKGVSDRQFTFFHYSLSLLVSVRDLFLSWDFFFNLFCMALSVILQSCMKCLPPLGLHRGQVRRNIVLLTLVFLAFTASAVVFGPLPLFKRAGVCRK